MRKQRSSVLCSQFDKLREAHVHKLHGYEIVPLPWVISTTKEFYSSWVIEVNRDFGFFYKNSLVHSSSKILLCTRDAKPCGFTTHFLDGMNIGVSKASMPSMQGESMFRQTLIVDRSGGHNIGNTRMIEGGWIKTP